MCISYLKWFCLENRLTRPEALALDGRAIDLKKVRLPLYVVGAAKDHICPWPATFQTSAMMGRTVRYVLADEGHITGIVNPPSPWSKKQYWAGGATRRRPWVQKPIRPSCPLRAAMCWSKVKFTQKYKYIANSSQLLPTIEFIIDTL